MEGGVDDLSMHNPLRIFKKQKAPNDRFPNRVRSGLLEHTRFRENLFHQLWIRDVDPGRSSKPCKRTRPFCRTKNKKSSKFNLYKYMLRLTIFLDDLCVERKDMRQNGIGEVDRLWLLFFHNCDQLFHVSDEESVRVATETLLSEKFLELPRPQPDPF